MLEKKIIPCLDICKGRVVKGVNFEGVQDVSDPVELAGFYNGSGADELVFYDINATYEERTLFTELFARVRKAVSIPLIAGGGIRTIEDFDRVFDAGADKASITSGALLNPKIIGEAAKKYGSPAIILAMDVKRVDGKFIAFTRGGRDDSGREAAEWAKFGEENGAGELVINSIDMDGVKKGFDLEMLKDIAANVSIPIIASGGAGKKEDFLELFRLKGITAGLAASIFHFKEVDIKELKQYLADNGIK